MFQEGRIIKYFPLSPLVASLSKKRGGMKSKYKIGITFNFYAIVLGNQSKAHEIHLFILFIPIILHRGS